ncbi:MAG: nitrogen fixation protein FixH [Thalassobium sp.]|uniref:FixH family protein n=1 Tax=Octadecabacter sp. SW4 TaxID=2602067 RepID=UPI000C0C9423|nr:FixH family protein [Octadecabacter sp. SW4]PHQ86912.1 MAG: nitrogen fixation protein FixH [Thalassobium sp.]QEE34297.1 FixH family protein [Octadecabacter sp. SW4]|tara:strand:- start:1812 stop:2267 length:456 start_codon:yes stop_codon:yes gene_type:complete
MAAPITGRKVFFGMSAAFGVIIAVNLFMAYSAVRTFPGLEVKNSYVASQNFDRDRAAQEALGWSIHAEVHQEELQLAITNDVGQPVEVAELTGTFGRATSVRDDQIPDFVFDGTLYRAPVATSAGNWNLRFEAMAKDGTMFRQRVVVLVER